MDPLVTFEEYRLLTGDSSSDGHRAKAVLSWLSARLRLELGDAGTAKLAGDALELAKALVCDAAAKALAAPSVDGAEFAPGVSQSSFTANGFQQSVTFSNPSGSAYWDHSMLAALKRAVGAGQRLGVVAAPMGRLA